MKQMLPGLAALACAAWLAVPVIASQSNTTQAAKTQTSTERTMWPPETINGTISMVDPAQRIVVVKDSSGVPFDMVVGRSTRIQEGTQKLNLNDLSSDVNKPVSVGFVPEGRGDIARSIHLKG